ncbi:MAG: DUF1326 domain-containing protein [Proteobacteria bacterium]|jgi:hypothetical protein|nr:DUF1326 domain-containing protein [Pseudomonadota bacterium]
MATSWAVKGEYMEACSCDFLCPCIVKNMSLPATHEFCKVALTFEITAGHFGDVKLDGVRFTMFAQSLALMSAGQWIGGLVIDSRASDDQAAAVGTIASAAGNGPLAMFAPLIADFRGVERALIEYERNDATHTVRIAGLLDQSVTGVASMTAPGQCIAIDNTAHPVSKRLNLATAVRNVIDAFGILWRDTSGNNNGHFSPFDWQGQAA